MSVGTHLIRNELIRLGKQLERLEAKLDEQDKQLKEIKIQTQRMYDHTNFVEKVYSRLRAPLDVFICYFNQARGIVGTESLPQIDNQ